MTGAYLLSEDDAFAIHRSHLNVLREFSSQEGVAILGADVILDALGHAAPLLREDDIHLTIEDQNMMGALIAE